MQTAPLPVATVVDLGAWIRSGRNGGRLWRFSMVKDQNPAWVELVQLVPIVSFALPFILAGGVDLARAGAGFLIGALLAVPVTAVVARRYLLNPILVGTNLWLWLGAIAFQLPLRPVAAWLTETQAVGLFVAALAVAIVATLTSSHGYVACAGADPRWVRRASLGLLALTVVMVGWAWVFRHDVRLGGGLPFIVLNVARRVMCLRAPRPGKPSIP